MKYLSIIFDVMILLFAVISIVKRYEFKKRLDIFIFANVAFGLYYAFVPMLIKTFDFDYRLGFMKTFNDFDGYKYFFSSLLCFLLYIIFLLTNRKLPNTCNSNEIKNKEYLISKDYRIYSFFANLCFILGAISFFIVSSSVGGIFELIKVGDIARAYGKDVGLLINRKLLPLITLMSIIVASPFLFYVMGKYKKTLYNKIMFILSFLISILFLLFNAGRAPILTFLLPFIVLWIFNKTKHPWVFVFIFVVLTVPTLKWLDNLFHYLNYGFIDTNNDSFNITQYFIVQFGFPYANIMNARNMVDYYGYRLGIDYFTWFINIIPIAILRKIGLSKVEVLTSYITLYYSYINNFSPINGGIPVDAFTIGYLQLGVIGAVIFVLLLSCFLRAIDKRSYMDSEYELKKIIYLRIGISLLYIIADINLDSLVRGRMDLIILIIIIFLTTKTSNENKNNLA